MLDLAADKDEFIKALLGRLKARLSITGESERHFAARIGSSDALFKNLRKGSMPTVDRLDAILRELGLHLSIGAPPVSSATPQQMQLDGDEYAHIPLHEAMLAAGSGYHNAGEAIVDHLAFRRDWLTRMGVTISAARVARVRGDSNQPTLWDGDMVLIDTSKRDPAIRRKGASDQRRSPFYALIDSGEARVKRIERPSPDVMMLISDNPDFPPELRHGDQLTDITITGRVIWSGHSFKDL